MWFRESSTNRRNRKERTRPVSRHNVGAIASCERTHDVDSMTPYGYCSTSLKEKVGPKVSLIELYDQRDISAKSEAKIPMCRSESEEVFSKAGAVAVDNFKDRAFWTCSTSGRTFPSNQPDLHLLPPSFFDSPHSFEFHIPSYCPFCSLLLALFLRIV